jgi:hypothetical protein
MQSIEETKNRYLLHHAKNAIENYPFLKFFSRNRNLDILKCPKLKITNSFFQKTIQDLLYNSRNNGKIDPIAFNLGGSGIFPLFSELTERYIFL